MAANSNSRSVDLDKVSKLMVVFAMHLLLYAMTKWNWCNTFLFAQQIWTTLREGIAQIYKREPSLTMAQYMDYYTYAYWLLIPFLCNEAEILNETNVKLFALVACRLVYNYCTTVQKSKEKSMNPNTGTAKSGGGGAELIGQELYKRLKHFLETYLIELLKVIIALCSIANISVSLMQRGSY